MVLLKSSCLTSLRHLKSLNSPAYAPVTQQKLCKTLQAQQTQFTSLHTDSKMKMYLTAEEELKVEEEDFYEEECQDYEEEMYREEETHEATDDEAKSWFKGILLMKYSFLSVLYAYYNL